MPFDLCLSDNLAIAALNGGLFIARGRGERHAVRTIDSHELIFVVQGELAMFEESRTFTVGAGQTLLLKAGLTHGGLAPYPHDLKFYWVHFRLADFPDRPGASLPQTATLADPERLTVLFRRFLDDQETQSRSGAVMDICVLTMLFEIMQPANRAPGTGATVPAQRADEYIRVHSVEPISAASVAAALGYHRDYLGRVYKKTFGAGLAEAINRRRIHEAKRLLLASDATIDQISNRTGYSDAEYFRRVFRKYEGVSPGAFRRLYARVHVNSE